MSSSEKILSRWSRLKREQEEKLVQKASDKGNPADPAPINEESAEPCETELSKEPADLPSVYAITTGSQVGAFLKAGVPAELARSALRRAWSSEPAIRDFIGLSENAWDFNAPAGVPGFGTLKAEEAAELLIQMFGERGEPSLLSAGESEPRGESSVPVSICKPENQISLPETGYAGQILDSGDQRVESQPDKSLSADLEGLKPPSRRHGGALPK